MSYCTNDILLLASGIWQSINSPSATSVGYISGWLTSSGNIGNINNKLFTSFYLSGDNPCLTDGNGGFAGEEADIYTLLFKAQYYEGQQLNLILGGGTTNGTFWTSMSEGDTKLARTDVANLAKVAGTMASEANKLLRLAIHDYQIRLSSPASIDACSLYSFPSP